MKVAKSVVMLAVGLALCSTLVGCKRRPEGVTPLPGRGPGGGYAGGLNSGGVVDPDGSGAVGIPLSGEDRSSWAADRETFRGSTVYFDLDKDIVKPSEMPKLETVANRMSSFPGKAVRIEGHCDERGTEEYNRS